MNWFARIWYGLLSFVRYGHKLFDSSTPKDGCLASRSRFHGCIDPCPTNMSPVATSSNVTRLGQKAFLCPANVAGMFLSCHLLWSNYNLLVCYCSLQIRNNYFGIYESDALCLSLKAEMRQNPESVCLEFEWRRCPAWVNSSKWQFKLMIWFFLLSSKILAFLAMRRTRFKLIARY